MPNNEVTKKEEKPQAQMSTILAHDFTKQLGVSLGLTKEQINRATCTALELSTNPALYYCDKFSLVKYCFETARYNFSRTDCVYPVPYKGKVQAQVGYKGFRELSMRSNAYGAIDATEVLSCDKLVRDRDTGKITVEFESDVNKTVDAHVVGYFAYATDKETGRVVNSVYWTKEKCEKHGKKYSQSYSSIWGADDTSFSKMAMKTVIKQLCGSLKSTPELDNAVKLDQIVFGSENEKDTYADNPLSKDIVEGDSEVINTIDTTDSE